MLIFWYNMEKTIIKVTKSVKFLTIYIEEFIKIIKTIRRRFALLLELILCMISFKINTF